MSTHIFEYIGNSDRFGYGKYLDFSIIIDGYTGYINATKLCALGNKHLRNWHKNESSKELIACYEDDTRSDQSGYGVSYEIGRKELAGLTKVEQESAMGTYYHRTIIVHLAQWISPAFGAKVSNILSNYESVLHQHIPTLNRGLPSFITDKHIVNEPLNAINGLIGHARRERTEPP